MTAWRNLWFHTGDIGRIDSDGYLFFVDRKGDYMRRRGENISSWELDKVFHEHPDVKDVCVHAVVSDVSEDDVKATVVPKDGSALTEEALCRWAADRLPYYALPRYFEFRPELPLSGTGRTTKHLLKDDGGYRRHLGPRGRRRDLRAPVMGERPVGLAGDDLGTPYLRFDRRGPLAWCVIDRPDSRNALTSAMYFGIRQAVDLVNGDPGLAGLIITGTGDVFVPGGELRGHEPDRWLDFPDLLGVDCTPFEAIRRSPKPVVSAVNGLAQGGGLLIAMLSDVAVAGESVTVRAPELLRGIADTGYAAYLPARIGIARARDMLLTGRVVSAREAEAWGIFGRVVPDAEVLRHAEEAAVQICRTAPQARLHLKRIINDDYDRVDRMTFDALLYNEEMAEGARAFAERREPSWVHPDLRAGGRL